MSLSRALQCRRTFLVCSEPSWHSAVVMTSFDAVIQRLLPIAILTISAVSVPVLILSSSGLPLLAALRAEKGQVDQEISRLSQQIRQLRVAVRQVKEDPAAVERVARDQLGLVRQTEVVFQFDR